ncbi:winged helix DNA-binding domain-containing protein [Demequina sp. TTPB684]|uniref:winged helix DNA-binding domain-containing protein n=1 Tax=unclassified Demequina TaxID=2620311 RepID=UPI001CF3C962|nr:MULTISPECIES: winged helix DNA-binding domain-containing protein [unclassified Demequina]MCB2411661.1 winged helix DNA-binding domain-containing protein [Demequina sp. TTPB684]UPU88039.1 winged helix DNA-binding domain-containing protein [Demequina sp. TMPB413]
MATPLSLSRADVDRARLASLLIDAAADPARTALGVVEHFLAMQAQDAPGVAWSLGLRTGDTEKVTATELRGHDVVRTWPMRGTLHLIPSRDAKWMLELMGGKALAGAAKRREFLGLPENVAHQAVDVLAALVADADGPVTRKACLAALDDAGIAPENQRGYHLLWFASQLGYLAGGPPQGKEQTFVDLDTWAPEHRAPARDEALALVAAAYVRGHGPVTDREMSRWTGLGLRDCRAGLAAAVSSDEGIVEAITDAGPAWVSAAVLDPPDVAPTRLLPGFDEFMLGYSQDERAINPAHHGAVVPGNNGVFKPTVIDDGRVVALWSRTVMTRSVRIEVTPLAALNPAAQARIADAAQEYAHYVELPLEVRWADS